MNNKPLAEMTTEELRAEFARLQRNALTHATRDEWMAQVTDIAWNLSGEEEPTPLEWTVAASRATTACDRCRATGTYSWGAVINGRPQHTAQCFRCGGKGRQGQDDYRRNYGYDRYAVSKAAREMMAS